MEDLILALTARLADSAVPLYLSDVVPENTAFPYVTAEIIAPLRTDKPGSIRLTIWSNSPNVNEVRMALHTTLMHHIPLRGFTLQSEKGRYILRPETASLAQSGQARGICTPLEVYFYPAGKEADPA